VRIDPHQTGSVDKGIDRLQLIKFWPSRAPGKGICGGAKIFGSAFLQPAGSVCAPLSAFFHIGAKDDGGGGDNWSRHQVVVPRYNTSTFGRRAFSVAGPTVWNSLPDKLHDPSLFTID